MTNTNICGLQVNYRQYLIKEKKIQEDGLTVYTLESNTNEFKLKTDNKNFELYDTNSKIIDAGIITSIKWLIDDIKPGIQ